MFEIGEKVICVDDSIKLGMEEFVSEAYLNWIKKGKEYTVRGFTDNDGIVTGMWLEEVHNFPIFIDLIGREQEPAFRLNRFAKREQAGVLVEELEEELIEV